MHFKVMSKLSWCRHQPPLIVPYFQPLSRGWLHRGSSLVLMWMGSASEWGDVCITLSTEPGVVGYTPWILVSLSLIWIFPPSHMPTWRWWKQRKEFYFHRFSTTPTSIMVKGRKCRLTIYFCKWLLPLTKLVLLIIINLRAEDSMDWSLGIFKSRINIH